MYTHMYMYMSAYIYIYIYIHMTSPPALRRRVLRRRVRQRRTLRIRWISGGGGDAGVCKQALLLREPWPCNPAETAIQPQTRCFQS